MDFSASDLYFWRIILAVIWSILIQFMLLSSYLIIVNVDLWHSDVIGASVITLCLKSLYIIPLAIVIFFQGIINSRDYLKPQAHFINKRYLILANIFSYNNITALFMFVGLGFSVFYVYSSLSNGSINLIYGECSINDTTSLFDTNSCLNERKLFLIFGGIWMGFFSFINDYLYNSKTLIFPAIQQHKFKRVKTILLPLIKISLMKAIFPCILFCMCYYFKGGIVRTYISSFSGLSFTKYQLDTMYIFLDIELMVYLWLFTSIYFFTLSITTTLFNIHLTERVYFPITTAMVPSVSEKTLLLRDALSAVTNPIIQHLGFLDLALLSQFDCLRRAELFMLSQPGGHPHSWNAVVRECSKIIENFTADLNTCINVSHIEKSDRKYPEKSSNTSHMCHQPVYNMRNLSFKPDTECYQSPSVVVQESYERFLSVYQEWFYRKLDIFRKKPIIVYVFGEMNEPKIKHLLFQSQPVMWAIKSLSFLICSSLKEDSFGVAQNDLSNIIVTLLRLKNGLDKLQKQSAFIKKSNKLDLLDMQMKNALKCCVKQSIYRIAVTFKGYIKEINLTPSEYNLQIMNFIEFKEV